MTTPDDNDEFETKICLEKRPERRSIERDDCSDLFDNHFALLRGIIREKDTVIFNLRNEVEQLRSYINESNRRK